MCSTIQVIRVSTACHVIPKQRLMSTPFDYSQTKAETRICAACGIEQPVTEFVRDMNKVGGHRARCKTCEMSGNFVTTRTIACDLCGKPVVVARYVNHSKCPSCKAGRKAAHRERKHHYSKQPEYEQVCDRCKFATVCHTEVWRLSFTPPCFAESKQYQLWLSENPREASHRQKETE